MPVTCIPADADDEPTPLQAVMMPAGLLFFELLFLSFRQLFVALFTFPDEFKMLLKERASGMYRLSAFYFARTASDLPMDMAIPTLFLLLVYFMGHLRYTAAAFFANFFTVILVMLVSLLLLSKDCPVAAASAATLSVAAASAHAAIAAAAKPAMPAMPAIPKVFQAVCGCSTPSIFFACASKPSAGRQQEARHAYRSTPSGFGSHRPAMLLADALLLLSVLALLGLQKSVL